ncbi:MAG: beta-lactamase family protein [Agarilytica sp.]
MKRLLVLIPTALAFVLSLSHCGGNNSTAVPDTSTTGTTPETPITGIAGDGTLSEKLDTIITAAQRPAIAAFSISEGQVIEMASTGLRSADSTVAVTDNDLWFVGSIGKSMTATLVAFMVDAGFLTWETSINDVFPEWSDSTLAKYRNIQIQQLLSHTSGLEDEFPDSIWNFLDSDRSGPEVRYIVSRIALSYDHGYPENSFQYANINYGIAGAMLEKLSGQTWRELIDERVFHPLGINQFGFGLPGVPGTLDQPVGHLFNTPGDSPFHPAIGPAGSIHFSLSSMAIYANFHLQGLRGEGSMLSRASYEKLYQPKIPSLYGGGDYALGWFRNGNRIFHGGTNTRWYALLEINAEHNTAYFAVSNSYSEGWTVGLTSHGQIEIFIGQALDLLIRRLDNRHQNN